MLGRQQTSVCKQEVAFRGTERGREGGREGGRERERGKEEGYHLCIYTVGVGRRGDLAELNECGEWPDLRGLGWCALDGVENRPNLRSEGLLLLLSKQVGRH